LSVLGTPFRLAPPSKFYEFCDMMETVYFGIGRPILTVKNRGFGRNRRVLQSEIGTPLLFTLCC
jgi:hypothetical protein